MSVKPYYQDKERLMGTTKDDSGVMMFGTSYRGDATVRAKFDSGVMMFGTSYRKWWSTLGEYCRRFKKPMPTIEISPEPWIGLKWCPEEDFQSQLDIEANGRTVADFKFRQPNRIELNCLRSEFPSA